MENQQQTRDHYYFVMGEVTFIKPGTKDESISPRLNTFITCPEQQLGPKDIARANAALQMTLQRRLAPAVSEPVQVIDVVVHSLTYIGQHTKDEFAAAIGR